MLGSLIVYTGLALIGGGVVLLIWPVRWLGATRRTGGLVVAGAGLLGAMVGLVLPAPESRSGAAATRLDQLMPAWQFREFHSMTVDAPAAQVYEAIKAVRADEISLFRTLTWLRRGGRSLPAGILNAGNQESLLDVATRTDFIWLADEPPRELVVGTVIRRPPGHQEALAPQLWLDPPGPGFTLAAMNFVVAPDGPDRSRVSTETRVFATDPSARRRFAAYWRVIYPGSAIIRRMWLRAIERRATTMP